jgi:hypothetical protein
MSCELLEATSKTDRIAMVDQIVMDTSRRSIDLRVAKTMGTNIPVNFVYGDPSYTNETISFLPVNDNELLIVAIRAGTANAFSLDSKGILVMMYTSPGVAAESFRWKCER